MVMLEGRRWNSLRNSLVFGRGDGCCCGGGCSCRGGCGGGCCGGAAVVVVVVVAVVVVAVVVVRKYIPAALCLGDRRAGCRLVLERGGRCRDALRFAERTVA